MISEFVVTFREVFEIGLALSILLKLSPGTSKKYIYYGLGGSLVVGVLFASVMHGLWETFEDLIEGFLMLLGPLLVLTFVKWISEKRVIENVKRDTSSWMLFLSSFLLSLREIIEIVAFLFSISLINGLSYWGILLGVGAGILLSYLLYKSLMVFNVKWVLDVSMVALIIVGGLIFKEGLEILLRFLDTAEELSWIGKIFYVLGGLYLAFKR